MDEESRTKLAKRYERELAKGERFWPDSIYKDVLMALAILVVLILLATFIGVPVEPKADPSDTSYIPRPEWYFLFLFKFLAIYGQIPLIGKIEWLAAVLIPGIFIALLVFLPFIDRFHGNLCHQHGLPDLPFRCSNHAGRRILPSGSAPDDRGSYHTRGRLCFTGIDEFRFQEDFIENDDRDHTY